MGPSRRVLILGFVISALAGRPLAQAVTPQRVPVELYEEALDLDGAVRVGARNADVTMVEFFDYNCPIAGARPRTCRPCSRATRTSPTCW